ncbi:MAG: hypothetical protein ACJA2D_000408 [Pseudohongiellaceae bacterium]|jgi:hypothetical protein
MQWRRDEPIKISRTVGHKEYCKMLYLQVESTNATAFGLYQKLSFTTKNNFWFRFRG